MSDKKQILLERIQKFAWLYDKFSGFLSDEERKIYKGIGLSKSSLDRINKSIEHYFMDYDKETPAMRVGTAFHTLVLEPDKFEKYYACGPDTDRRTSAGKKAWKEAEDENDGKSLISISDWDMIHHMQDSVSNHKLASHLLNPELGAAEETMMWNDQELGTLMKGRSDFRNFKEKVIIDLKSTMDATPDKLERDLWSTDLRYHVQAAIYTDGARAILGDDSWEFYFVFVEKKPPYSVQIVHLPPKAIDIGRIQYHENVIFLLKWLERSSNMLKNGVADDFSEENIIELHPPAWLVQKIKKQSRMLNEL